MADGEEVLHVAVESLDWSLRHTLKYGDTDIFPIPFEYRHIEKRWAAVQPELLAKNVINPSPVPLRRCLTPKHRFGFRVASQMDPIDHLLFTAIVYEVADRIERCRVSTADDVVYSYRVRLHKDGHFFDPQISYPAFEQRCKDHLGSPSSNFVVLADVVRSLA